MMLATDGGAWGGLRVSTIDVAAGGVTRPGSIRSATAAASSAESCFVGVALILADEPLPPIAAAIPDKPD